MPPTAKVSARGASNRVRLLDAAVDAGLMSKERARDQLPRITSLAWQGDFKPDDDFALAIGGVFITDNRNNLGMDYSAIYNEARANRYPGDHFECFTFDGWPGLWFHAKWTLKVIFSTKETEIISGGTNSGQKPSSMKAPIPIPPDYYKRPQKINDHYRNGHGSLPLPKSWPWPRFLNDKVEEYQSSEYRTSSPSAS